MRLLVLGGYGFIGGEIVRALLNRNHEVIGLARDPARGRRLFPDASWLAGNLDAMVNPSAWLPLLGGMDAVINASGLLQSGDGGSVKRVQRDSISALIAAGEESLLARFVQISALGASVTARTDFMASKGEADALLGASAIDHVILRPGLVIGRNCYGGSELIRIAAAIPAFAVELDVNGLIQTVAMADVVKAVLNSLELPTGTRRSVDLVERQARSLSDIIALHRRWLGLAPARWPIALPELVLKAIARVADGLGRLGWRSPLRSNAIAALGEGIRGDSSETHALLGRSPLSLEEVMAMSNAGKQDRLFARMGLLLPLMLAALALLWVASGVATLVHLDKALALLVAAGMSADAARPIAICGAIADLAVAVALLWRQAARPALAAMIVLTLLYLVAGSLLAPGLWLDPLAPYAKTIPAALLALITFHMLDKR